MGQHLLADLDECLLHLHSIEAVHLHNDPLASLWAPMLACNTAQPAQQTHLDKSTCYNCTWHVNNLRTS